MLCSTAYCFRTWSAAQYFLNCKCADVDIICTHTHVIVSGYLNHIQYYTGQLRPWKRYNLLFSKCVRLLFSCYVTILEGTGILEQHLESSLIPLKCWSPLNAGEEWSGSSSSCVQANQNQMVVLSLKGHYGPQLLFVEVTLHFLCTFSSLG